MINKPKKLFIIDGHAHIYSAYYAPMRPLVAPNGEPTKAVYVFTNMLLGLIEKQKPDMLVVTMDSKAPCFRKDIYPEYKANRSPMPEDMPGQIVRIEQLLDALNIPKLRVDGFEADDLIGTLARKASKAGIEAYICSRDKDMLQLLDENVSMFDVKSGDCTTPKSMLDKMGINPDQFIDVLALQGDTADNVPGVADVGPKTAITWIQKYGSMENLYAHADEIKGKRGESLRSSKEIADLSKELVTIDCDSPAELDEDAFNLDAPDNEKLAGFFAEMGFNKMLEKLGGSAADIEIPSQTQSAKTVEKDYRLVDDEETFYRFLALLKTKTTFAIDTETTSVNAMAANLVGISVSWKRDMGYYLVIKAPMGQPTLDIKMVREKLGPILADEKIRKIGQNIKYDMLILENAGLPLKGIWFDTMVASYCLSDERRSNSMDNMARDYLNYETIPITDLIGKGKNQLTFDMVDTEVATKYAAEDADITFMLYEYLAAKLDEKPKIKKLFTDVEMPLVPVLTRMEYNGVAVDVPALRKMSHELAESLDKLSTDIFEAAGKPFNINSPKQVAEVLFDDLGLKSSKTGKSARSTSADVLEEMAGQHEILNLMLGYRQLFKLKSTYTDTLAKLVNSRTGRIHPSFNQTVTVTGRLSSSDPNLQNIPIRTDLGKKIRAMFIAPDKADCILSIDYSQVELRVLAALSKDEALLQAFTDGQDIHQFVAAQVNGVDLEDVDKDMRAKAKAVNFGIIYGQGPFALSRSLGISMGQAKQFIDDYFARYAAIRQFMDDSVETAKQTGHAETILGRQRKIDGLDSKNANRRSQGERLTVNTIIQGSASDLIKVAMINIQKRIDEENLPIKMILQIHDELVFELSREDAEKHAGWIADEMSNAIDLGVPLKVDIETGSNWLGD